jgi:hypothetical protein
MRARNVSRARGASQPEFQDLQSALSDPNSPTAKLTMEQVNYLKRSADAIDTHAAALRASAASETDPKAKADLLARATYAEQSKSRLTTDQSLLQNPRKIEELLTTKQLEEMQAKQNKIMEDIKNSNKTLTDSATEKPSIYTHDIHLEESLEWIWESIESVNSNSVAIIERLDTMIDMQSEMASVSAMLPGIDVEEEIKKRQMNTDTGTNEIVANTGETAENTRRTAILMGALLNCMRRNSRRTGSPINVEGENVDESAFFDQFIDCEWVDTTARSPAYVWRQGNIGKKN